MYAKIIQTISKLYPAIIPYLKGQARFIAIYDPSECKTVAYFTKEMTRMILNVYKGFTGGEFIDILFNLVAGQMKQAADQAWKDEDGEGATPSYLNELVMSAVLKQASSIDKIYRDIIDAKVDERPVEPILSRVPLWANRWNEVYNQAVALIAAQRGGNLVWRLGQAEHCSTCSALNGIVASATEWQALDVYPQNAPNGKLECGGWNCKCTLTPTKAKRTKRAYELIAAAIGV